MSEWIKCSDRMPSMESAVLVLHSCGEVWCAVRTSHGWDDGIYDAAQDVTHWMPLPPPPEE